MKKVLMCGNHSSNKGGMTSVIEQIMEYDWEKEGIKLSFIPTFKPGNVVTKSIFFLWAYIKIFFFFLIERPDFVHMHMSYKGSFTRKYLIHRLCRLFGVSDVIHLHGSEFKKWYNDSPTKKQLKIRRLLKESNYFIVLGEKWKKIILEIEPQTNVRIISNGIRIPKETVQWDENECNMLFLGVLISRKGVHDLINAIVLLNETKKLNNIRFVIAGTGDEEDALKKQVTDSGLNQFVKFLGWINGTDKYDVMLHSQIMVLPSYNEGLPISILEAISYGMPVISTPVGDIPSAIKDGINGYLVEPGNVQQIANAIEKLSTKSCFDDMSFNSRKIAENSFSIDYFYKKLIEIYDN